MARDADVSVLQQHPDDSEVAILRDIVNRLVDELDALYAKLDADATLAATNWASTLAVSANAYKIDAHK